MKLKMDYVLALGAALAAGPAMAELVFPSLRLSHGAPMRRMHSVCRTAMRNYFTLLNERDGGDRW